MESSQVASDAGSRQLSRLTLRATRGSWASMRSAPLAPSANIARSPMLSGEAWGASREDHRGTACSLLRPGSSC